MFNKKVYMHEYNKKYREKNREKLNAYNGKYRTDHREILLAYDKKRCLTEAYRQKQRDRNRDIKREVLNHYGNKCACCGEYRIEFLTIDHINGGGNKHRKEIGRGGSSLYKWLEYHNFPEGYRVLCFNCNCSIGCFGYCPHGNLI